MSEKSYTAYEIVEDDKMLPHRMREISDSLSRTNPNKRVDFQTHYYGNGTWELKYTISEGPETLYG